MLVDTNRCLDDTIQIGMFHPNAPGAICICVGILDTRHSLGRKMNKVSTQKHFPALGGKKGEKGRSVRGLGVTAWIGMRVSNSLLILGQLPIRSASYRKSFREDGMGLFREESSRGTATGPSLIHVQCAVLYWAVNRLRRPHWGIPLPGIAVQLAVQYRVSVIIYQGQALRENLQKAMQKIRKAGVWDWLQKHGFKIYRFSSCLPTTEKLYHDGRLVR